MFDDFQLDTKWIEDFTFDKSEIFSLPYFLLEFKVLVMAILPLLMSFKTCSLIGSRLLIGYKSESSSPIFILLEFGFCCGEIAFSIFPLSSVF